jgi:hypothetical protein
VPLLDINPLNKKLLKNSILQMQSAGWSKMTQSNPAVLSKMTKRVTIST